MAGTELPDWTEIVELHGQRVFRVAFRVLGSVQDAEDVSQEVFSEAFRLHRTSHVESWTGLLVRLATLRSIDHLRRAQAGVELKETDGVSEEEPFQQAIAAELAALLRQEIARLPEQQAAALVMKYFDHFSHDEISAVLGISTNAVATTLYKARQRLQDHLTTFHRGVVK